jgi:hypothetical protein
MGQSWKPDPPEDEEKPPSRGEMVREVHATVSKLLDCKAEAIRTIQGIDINLARLRRDLNRLTFLGFAVEQRN